MNRLKRFASEWKAASMLRRFLINNMIIILLPLILVVIGNSSVQRAMEQSVIEAEGRALGQMVSNLDDAINGIRQTAVEISSDADIKVFSNVRQPMAADSRIKAAKLVRTLSRYYAYESMVDGYFIFFPRSDVVLNYSAMYSPAFYYDYFLNYEGMSYDVWMNEIMRGSMDATFLATQNTLNYITPLPITPNSSQRTSLGAVLSVQINRRALEKRLQGILPGGALYVLDARGQLLSSVGETSKYPLSIDSAPSASNERSAVSARGGVTIIHQHSANTGWQYYLLVPDTVLAADSVAIGLWMRWLILACLFIGAVCAIFFSYQSYRPIGKLRDEALSYEPNAADIKRVNEIDQIRASLTRVHKDNAQLAYAQEQVLNKYEHLRRFSSRNQRLLMDGLIMRIARGQVDDWDAVHTWMEAASVQFDGRNTIVAMAHISEYSGFTEQAHGKEESSLVHFAVQSVTEDMFATIGRCYALTTLNSTLLLMINTDEDEATVIGVLEAIQEFLHDKAQILTSIGVGSMQTRLEDIPISQEEAKQALEYRFVQGKGRVIRYKDIQTEQNVIIRLSEDRLRQMGMAVLRRDEVLLGSMLDKTFNELSNLGQMSMLQAQSLYYDIIGMVMRTLDTVNATVSDIFGKGYDPLSELTACETINEVFEVLRSVLTKVCAYKVETSGRSARLVDDALRFIEANYMRHDFSQSMVAEAIGVSSAYLSRIMKSTLHENMVDICNRLRIEKAKEYLLGTDMTLQEIAEHVGLMTVKSLIRIFKQYTGVTPGKLRETAGAEEGPSGE